VALEERARPIIIRCGSLAKLAGLAGAVTAAAGAISVLFSWYYPPYFGADNKARGPLRS